MRNRVITIIVIHKIFFLSFIRNLVHHKNRNVTLFLFLLLLVVFLLFLTPAFIVIDSLPKSIFNVNPLIFFVFFAIIDLFIKGLFSKDICNTSYVQLTNIGLSLSNASSIILYALNFSLTHIFSLFVLLPIVVRLGTISTNLPLSINFTFSILLVSFINNFIISLFDILFYKTVFSRRLILPAFLIITSGFSLMITATNKFNFPNSFQLLNFLNILLFFLLLYLNHKMIKKFFYHFGVDSNKNISTTSTKRILRIKSITLLITLIDIIAIGRNKRIRNMYLSNLILVAYLTFTLITTYYKDAEPNNFGLLILYFSNMVFTAQFGQFILHWQSDYQFFFNSCKISMTELIKARGLLFFIFLMISSLISVLLSLILNQSTLIILSSILFQIGICLPLLFTISLFYGTPINLNQKTFLNFNGFNSKTYIYNMALFIIPILLFLLLTSILNRNAALYIIACMGLLGLLLQYIFRSKIFTYFENKKRVLSFTKIEVNANKD